MTGVSILGSGVYLPSEQVGNHRLETRLGLPSGFIERKTGVLNRRVSDGDPQRLEIMAAAATRDAVENANVDSIGAIINVRDVIATRRALSLTLPILAGLQVAGINTEGAHSIDIANYCPGFVYAVNLAQLMVRNDQVENVVVVAATDYTDLILPDSEFNESFRDGFNSEHGNVQQYSLGSGGELQAPALNAFLWGCGAGAVVVGKSKKDRIIGYQAMGSKDIRCDAFGVGESSRTRGGKIFASLDGTSIVDFAVEEVPTFINESIEEFGLSKRGVRIVPHQPQPKMLEKLREEIGISSDHFYVTCDTLGNMIGASMPITYHLARNDRKIKSRNKIMFCGFGDSYLSAATLAFEEK